MTLWSCDIIDKKKNSRFPTDSDNLRQIMTFSVPSPSSRPLLDFRRHMGSAAERVEVDLPNQ